MISWHFKVMQNMVKLQMKEFSRLFLAKIYNLKF